LAHENLPGAQLRYLLYGRGQPLLGAIGFGAAAWKVACRDQWIGWNAEQRRRRLDLVLNNARFLMLPWLRVPNLAGYCLRECLRRLPEDFQQRYGWRPVLLETFVEARFQGHCYGAAHWIGLGRTQGRGKKGAQAVGGQTPLPGQARKVTERMGQAPGASQRGAAKDWTGAMGRYRLWEAPPVTAEAIFASNSPSKRRTVTAGWKLRVEPVSCAPSVPSSW
jgi:hypothetical protein